jgi:SAM-dependent methyltransferase
VKNQDKWKETRFALTNGRLHVNKEDPNLNISSWIITECTARAYNKYLPTYANGSLLDLGCGNCPLYGFYQQFVDSVICIDWENSLHPNPYNDLCCDISQPLSLADASFDTILLADVLEHLFNPVDMLKESYRLLKHDGIILINVPFLYWIHESPNDFYRYTEFALRKLAEKTGFKVEVIDVVGGSLETWFDLTSKLGSYLPILRSFLSRLLFELSCWLRKSNSLNRKLKVIDTIFPTGYFMVLRKNE